MLFLYFEISVKERFPLKYLLVFNLIVISLYLFNSLNHLGFYKLKIFHRFVQLHLQKFHVKNLIFNFDNFIMILDVYLNLP